ncbi:MAG: hypothetical protein ACXWUP_05490 [Allosphingosinicella sp.]
MREARYFHAAVKFRLFGLFLFALVSMWAGPATAAVEIRFHSKDFGATFPHAFISFAGTLDSTGERIEANYGFTVRHLIGPSVLFGPVQGEVISERPEYVASADRHFAMVLTDDEYRRTMALVERWRALPQPSYALDRRNCVSFVADVAALLGLRADPHGMMRRPRAFLERVGRDNQSVLAARSGTQDRLTAMSR